MILLENSSGEHLLGKAEAAILWGKSLDSEVNFDGFILFLGYIEESIKQVIYSVAKEECRVLLN